MSVYHSLEESQSDSPSTCSSLVVCVQNGGQGSRITHLSHAPPPGVYIITHAQNVFLLPSFINVRLCTCVVVVCIFSNLCLLLTDLVLTCGVKLYIYFLCGKMFSFRRASFRLSLQKETAKNGMSHLWRLLAHRIGVATNFHNAQRVIVAVTCHSWVLRPFNEGVESGRGSPMSLVGAFVIGSRALICKKSKCFKAFDCMFYSGLRDKKKVAIPP